MTSVTANIVKEIDFEIEKLGEVYFSKSTLDKATNQRVSNTYRFFSMFNKEILREYLKTGAHKSLHPEFGKLIRPQRESRAKVYFNTQSI